MTFNGYPYFVELIARHTLRMGKPYPDDEVLDRVREVWSNAVVEHLMTDQLLPKLRSDIVSGILQQLQDDYGSNSLAHLAKTVGQLEQIRLHQFMKLNDIVDLYLQKQGIIQYTDTPELFWYRLLESVKNMNVQVREKHYSSVTFKIPDTSLDELRAQIVGKVVKSHAEVSASMESEVTE